MEYALDAANILEDFASKTKNYIMAQYLDYRRRFERTHSPKLSDASVTEKALIEFDGGWKDAESRLEAVSGKEALHSFNQCLQDAYGVSVTHTAILDAIRTAEIAAELEQLVSKISQFALSTVS